MELLEFNKKNVAQFFKDNFNYCGYIGIFNDEDPNNRADILKTNCLGSPVQARPARNLFQVFHKKINHQFNSIFNTFIGSINIHLKYPSQISNFFKSITMFLKTNILENYINNNGYGEIPPLKQSTIQKKHNNKIWRDTYAMIKAIKVRVKKK